MDETGKQKIEILVFAAVQTRHLEQKQEQNEKPQRHLTAKIGNESRRKL